MADTPSPQDMDAAMAELGRRFPPLLADERCGNGCMNEPVLPMGQRCLACVVRAALQSRGHEAQEAGQGWRGIESAPRDGSFVLVAHPQGGPTMARWSSWASGGVWSTGMAYIGYKPTHWMPVPERPAAPPPSEVNP